MKERKNEERRYEFCDLCRLNHNQGSRHAYFPRHKSAISTLLTRFQSNLNDVKLFLKSPIPLRADIADRNRFWCLFCGCEVLELGSEFSCGNTIRHLASREHWKKVKEFMWKNKAGMDRVDIFRIVDVDFKKWEKKIDSIKNHKVKADPDGAVSVGPSNNIQNEPNADFASTFHEQPVSFNVENNVLPLQMNTNEEAQVLHSESSFVCETASSNHFMPGLAQEGAADLSKMSAGGLHNHRYTDSVVAYPGNGSKVFYGGTSANGDGSAPGFIHLTRIPKREETIGRKVHTGAPPPWFDQPGEDQHDIKDATVIGHSVKPGKSSKLNPKRVGAAWAERRKLEMELEKRGELVANHYDPNWLPDFGSVWHSGTRKDSRKKFQMQTNGSVQIDYNPPKSPPLQPYVGKRKLTAIVASPPKSPLPLQPYIGKRKRTIENG